MNPRKIPFVLGDARALEQHCQEPPHLRRDEDDDGRAAELLELRDVGQRLSGFMSYRPPSVTCDVLTWPLRKNLSGTCLSALSARR